MFSYWGWGSASIPVSPSSARLQARGAAHSSTSALHSSFLQGCSGTLPRWVPPRAVGPCSLGQLAGISTSRTRYHLSPPGGLDLSSAAMPMAGWCWAKAVHPGIRTLLIPGAGSHLECWETLSERNACAAGVECQAASEPLTGPPSAVLRTVGIVCGCPEPCSRQTGDRGLVPAFDRLTKPLFSD